MAGEALAGLAVGSKRRSEGLPMQWASPLLIGTRPVFSCAEPPKPA